MKIRQGFILAFILLNGGLLFMLWNQYLAAASLFIIATGILSYVLLKGGDTHG